MMTRSNQILVQDQNFANETFFTCLSTLESLRNYYAKKDLKKTNKMFGAYDNFDYTAKTLAELKSQLSIHTMLFQSSKIVWSKEHPD